MKKILFLIKRYKALKWWNSITIVEKAYNLSRMKDLGFLENKKVETLTTKDIIQCYETI